MYIIKIKTPANDNPKKMVDTFYCKIVQENGLKYTEWDEDKKYAYRFINKVDAKKVQSYLRTLKGSEKCKIVLETMFSKS